MQTSDSNPPGWRLSVSSFHVTRSVPIRCSQVSQQLFGKDFVQLRDACRRIKTSKFSQTVHQFAWAFFLFNSHVTTHLHQVHAQKECNRTTFAFHRLHDRISLFGALEKGNSDPSETKIPWGMAHLIQPQVFLFGTHKLIPLTFKPG